MAQMPTINDMAKRVAEEAKKNLEVNDMPLDEFKTLVDNLAQCDKVQLARNFMVKISRGETQYKNVDKLRVLNKATDGLLKDYIKEINNDE